MVREFFIQSLELKAIWLLKFQPRTMMALKPIYLHQVLYYLLCMLEIHLLKKQHQTTLITNF